MEQLLGAVDPPAPFAAAIARRDLVSWGGYALLRKSSSCPSSTSSCDAGSCCPDSYSCSGDSNQGKVCCPSKTDCSSTVKAVYACADKSWTLWRLSCPTCITVTFCCAGDEVGTYDPAGGLQCISKAVPVPKSIILSSIDQRTTSDGASTIGAAPTTTGAGSRTRATTSGANSDPGTGPGSSSSSSILPSDGNSGPAGLPQAAVIAIAVLATALGMLAASLVCFVFYQRRRKAPNGQQATAPPPTYYVSPQPQTEELHGQTAAVVVAGVQESRSDPRFELAGQPRK